MAARVKICCIASIEEARLAISYGASAIGLVSEMPSGPGVIDWDTIEQIVNETPETVEKFLLTCAQDADAIIAQQRRTGVDTLQLVDSVAPAEIERIRDALPDVMIVQVVHVTGPESLEEARQASLHADRLLLDSGNPSLPVKELGGTARCHDWGISRRIVESVDIPVFLAGGLHPGNAGEALRQVMPYGLDVCSGLRTDGKLDENRVAAFFDAVTG